MTEPPDPEPVAVIVPSREVKAQRPKYAYHNEDLSERDLQALDHFEQAVDLEHNKRFGEAISLYREAYQKNSRVDKLYREKYYSPNAKQEQELQNRMEKLAISEQQDQDIDSQQSPNDEPSPLSDTPSEILVRIMEHVAFDDVTSFVNLLCVNKRFAELGACSESIWRQMCLKAYSAQTYCKNIDNPLVIGQSASSHYKSSFRYMYRHRPFIRFNGVYISTCTYSRDGLSIGWNTPIYLVTYYRYLRFFEDGACMSLLTVLPPIDVVPVFFRHDLTSPPIVCHREDGTLIQRPKNIVQGTWQLSDVDKGNLAIELPGPAERYTFYMKMRIGSSGIRRHNKLKWIDFWGINKETGNKSDFTLKHDEAYYFERTNP